MNILTILIFKCKIFTLPHNPIPGEKRSKEPLMNKILSTVLALVIYLFPSSSIAHAACGANQHKDPSTGNCVDNPPVPPAEVDAQKRKNQREQAKQEKKPAETTTPAK
jgi:hypothetical protein